MSGARWKLSRLRAMSPREMVRRGSIALRDRLTPPSYLRWPPEEAFERLFPAGRSAAFEQSRLAALVPPAALAPDPSVESAAAAIAAGRLSLFGSAVRLDDPPRWRANPVTRSEWPDRPSVAIDYRTPGAAGDPKYAWELGRLTFLPPLAQAWRMTGDRAYAERAARWLESFTYANPMGRGIHHTSGIEMAVRVITTTWTLALLAGSGVEERLAPALGLAIQQALYCRDHPSLGSSANNHLIAECAAMTVAGAMFPTLRGARAMLAHGFAGLERETLRQIHPDGVTAEQAFGYLPFVWELLLAGFVAGAAAGRTVAAPVRERLAASLEFARAVRLPDGTTPRVGDEDDGRIFLPGEDATRLDRVGGALAAFLEREALGSDAALARLLIGRAPPPARVAADGVHPFPHGGYTVWRNGKLLATFDHGPLGLGALAAHGHADALSITIHAGAAPLVLDPGTFAYFGDPAARARCRGTPGHATVRFGERSQSHMLGPFMWGARARVTPLDDGFEVVWADGERHWRRVRIEAGTITIEDRVSAGEAALDFTLPPDAEVSLDGATASVRAGGVSARFECEDAGPWQRRPAECAQRFGQVIATTKLTAPIAGALCKTVIRIEG